MFKPNILQREAGEAANAAAAVEHLHMIQRAVDYGGPILARQGDIGPMAYVESLEKRVEAAVGHVASGIANELAAEMRLMGAEAQDAAQY